MQKRGCPGHRFNAQRVKRPQQCSQPRAHQQIVVLRAAQPFRLDQQQEFPNQQENQAGVEAMKQQAGQMIADGLPAEQFINDRPGQPRQRLVTHHVTRVAKHPAQRLRCDPLQMGIGVNLHIVVPINKIIFQDGPVNKGGQQQQTEDDQAFAQITTHSMSASRYRRRHRQVTRQNRWQGAPEHPKTWPKHEAHRTTRQRFGLRRCCAAL